MPICNQGSGPNLFDTIDRVIRCVTNSCQSIFNVHVLHWWSLQHAIFKAHYSFAYHNTNMRFYKFYVLILMNWFLGTFQATCISVINQHYIHLKFSARQISWSNVTSFTSCHILHFTMIGHRYGRIAKLHEHVPKIVDVWCLCHLANLGVGCPLKTTPLNLNDLLCSIHTHFSNR